MKLLRRLLLILLGLVLFLLVGLFIFRQEIGRYVLRRTVIALGKAIHWEVSYKTIEGDIFTHPRITGLCLTRQMDTIFISKLEVKYDIFALVQRRIVLSSVKIIDPDIRITQRVTKEVIKEGKTTFTFPNLSVRQLEIINGKVTLAGLKRIDSIGLKSNFSCSGTLLKLQVDSAGCRLTHEGLSIKSLTTEVRLDEGLLTVSNLQILTVSSELAAGFSLDINSGAIAVDTFNLSLNIQEITKIPGRVRLQGKGRIGEEIRFQANSWIGGLSYQQLSLPSFSGSFAIADSTLILRLGGANEILGGFALDAEFNLANFLFNAHITLDNVPVNKFKSGLPKFLLSATISADGKLGTIAQLLKKEDAKIKGDSINLLLRGSAKELGVDTLYATVKYHGQQTELRELVLSGSAGKFRFAGVARKGFVVAATEMGNFDLGVAGKFLSLPLTGRADGSLQVVLLGDSWKFTGLVHFDGLGVGGMEVTRGLIQADLTGSGFLKKPLENTIYGRIAVGGEGVRILGYEWNWAQFVWTGPEFDFQVEKDRQRLLATGDVSFEKSNILAVLRTFEFTINEETLELYDSCWVKVGRDSLWLSGLKINIADGEMECNASGRIGTMPQLGIRARNLNLRKIKELLGLNADLSGNLNFDLSGQDTFFFSWSGADIELPAANITFKYIDGSLLLTKGLLFLNSLRFVHERDTSIISGIFQYEVKDGFHFTRMDFDLHLADPGTWPFVVTRPYVEIQEGKLYGIAQVFWQPQDLSVTGRIRVQDGFLTVPSVDGKVDRFQAELTLKDNRIILEKLSGTTTKGILTAEGFLQLNPSGRCDSLRYTISFTGASAAPITGVYAIGDGEVSVSWREGEKAFISGGAVITEGLATIGFGGQPYKVASDSGGVDYDITVKAERGVWLRNRDADIELAADLIVRRVGEEALYSGEMVVKQGSVYYLDHILRITEGRLLFENSSQFDPQLNITAECPVPGKRENAPEKIVLSLTGRLSSPSFSFSSEPPLWDETQIITYLSLNVTMDELSALEEKELISRLLSERLLGYFQTQASKRVRDFIGLDYLEIQTGLTGDETRVTVGKYVGRNLYVSYTQNFTGELQPAFRIEYNLDQRSELLAERSYEGRYSFRYRFKLRF